MVNFRHGGGQVLMGGEMALMTLDGGGSPPIPPPIGKPCNLTVNEFFTVWKMMQRQLNELDI